ncbi:hypothetical protein LTR95_001694 [Oleoguttula sp. CCFEE 5521]
MNDVPPLTLNFQDQHAGLIDDTMVFKLRQDIDSPEGEGSSSTPSIKQEEAVLIMPKSRRARRERITRNACRQCRAKKTKCGGQHPICTRCQIASSCCTYDTSEGVTKMQSLKDQLESRTQDHARDAALLRILVEDSDQAATQLLAKLRLNHNEGTAFKNARRGSDPFPLQKPTLPDGRPVQYAYSASGGHSASSSVSSSHFQHLGQMAASTTAVSFDMSAYLSSSLPHDRFGGSLTDTPEDLTGEYSHLMEDTDMTSMTQQTHVW